jgi:hypothetical protein
MNSHDTVLVKLSKLKPDKKNARKHSERNIEEIARSLQQFGQHRPFVVQKSTGKILVGNGMYEAMKSLGWSEGLALYVEDDDETAVKRALADNRTGELAEWDWPVLKDIVQEFGPEPDIPGWSNEEIEDFFKSRESAYPEELNGIDLEPDELAALRGDDETPCGRVIIVFPHDQYPVLEKLLGIKISKTVYRLEELLNGTE